MISPVGSRQPLLSLSLEDGLAAYRCPETDGIYLPIASYLRWIASQPSRLPHVPPSGEESVEEEPGPARLCPETGTIMSRYRVGHGFRFTIDRSITGGIWLDAGEWEALRARNFHDELHFIFTEPWQRAIRREEAASGSAERLEERIGPEFAEELALLRDRISASPHRAEILAFLGRG